MLAFDTLFSCQGARGPGRRVERRSWALILIRPETGVQSGRLESRSQQDCATAGSVVQVGARAASGRPTATLPDPPGECQQTHHHGCEHNQPEQRPDESDHPTQQPEPQQHQRQHNKDIGDDIPHPAVHGAFTLTNRRLPT